MWLSSKKIKKVSSPAKKFRVKNGWRLHPLFRIEQLLIDAGVKDRAKRMGMCGNTIFVVADHYIVKTDKGLKRVKIDMENKKNINDEIRIEKL